MRHGWVQYALLHDGCQCLGHVLQHSPPLTRIHPLQQVRQAGQLGSLAAHTTKQCKLAAVELGALRRAMREPHTKRNAVGVTDTDVCADKITSQNESSKSPRNSGYRKGVTCHSGTCETAVCVCAPLVCWMYTRSAANVWRLHAVLHLATLKPATHHQVAHGRGCHVVQVHEHIRAVRMAQQLNHVALKHAHQICEQSQERVSQQCTHLGLVAWMAGKPYVTLHRMCA